MAGKIQRQDVKTEAELVGAGATKADLINDTQIYVTATGINKTLDDAIVDGDLGGGGGGITDMTLQVFTSSGTWNKPANLLFIEVWCVGGGGGSGGARAAVSGASARPGSGGGGGFTYERIPAASLGASVSVTVGSGGTAGAATPTNGGTGGTSSFGGFCSAAGGGGSLAVNQNVSGTGNSNGGGGGAGSGGNINISGQAGGNGSPSNAGSGIGGASLFGFGGIMVASVGTAGQNYGGGAAGPVATYIFSTATIAGGSGGQGIVYVKNYIG